MKIDPVEFTDLTAFNHIHMEHRVPQEETRMTETPYTPDQLRALADIVEKWTARLYTEDGDPVMEIDEIKLSSDGIEEYPASAGRIIVDHTGSYWGWSPS